MKRNSFLLITVVFLFSAGVVSAQEKPKNVFSRIQDFGKTLTERDLIKEGYNKILNEGQTGKNKFLAGLKNPFIPQTPKPEIAEIIEPEPEIMAQLEEFEPAEIIEPKKPEIPPPHVKISGLVWNTDRPQAILNDEVVGVGDTVDQWVVSEIKREGVVLSRDDNFFTIAAP